jgi:hypothetical protein
MAAPAVTLITDAELGAPWLRQRGGFYFGQRRYLVRTHKEEEALQFAPQENSPWSGSGRFKGLLLVDRSTEYWGGKDVTGTAPTSGGATIVTCEYEELRPGGRLVPTDGQKYTELLTALETQTIFFEHRDEGVVGPVLPLANGEGYGRKVGTVGARVHVFYRVGTAVDMTRWVRLSRSNPTNTAAVTLPELLGTRVSFTLGVGQVQYELLQPPQVVGGAGGAQLLEVVHQLALAPDFLFRWQREDRDGNGIAQISSRVYPREDLNGLW